MDDSRDGLIRTALLLALGLTRGIREDYEDWKETLLERGRTELKEYEKEFPLPLATKPDIKALSERTSDDIRALREQIVALSQQISGLKQEPDVSLVKFPAPPEKGHHG